MSNILTWAGILFCLSQSAIFSGLNLAFFRLSRLRLELVVEEGILKGAKTVLAMREDSNFLLTTILWGNVGINVLLTLLSESVMAGIASFVFSTMLITLFGEIIPQAYFSKHALRTASLLAPVLRFYQILLYPLAKPCALLLDAWLGKEAIQFFSEKSIQSFIKKHMEAGTPEIDKLEGAGAINFLALDDQHVSLEGSPIHAQSVISLPEIQGELRFPGFEAQPDDPFVRLITSSDKKWVILTNEASEPKWILNADEFIRSEVLGKRGQHITHYCHQPLIVREVDARLGAVLRGLKQHQLPNSDEPIDTDVVLVWSKADKRIITGADLFGRLLKGL